MISIPTKFKSKFIHQCHKLHTSPNFRSHQHCPNFTMPNNSTIQKCPKAKITTWSQEFSAKSYNVQNFNKGKQQQNDNVSTPSSQLNMKSTNFLAKKKIKKWAHIEVLFGVWSMGLGVLEEPFFLNPFKGWVIFFSH